MTTIYRFILLASVGAATALGGACLKSNTSQCGTKICPGNTTCMPGDVCVDSELVQPCIGQPNGARCVVPGLPPNVCENNICQASICGDGIVSGKEQCDGSNLAGASCQTQGFYSATGLSCNSDCTFNTSGCSGYCGDGIKNGPEECDGSAFGSANCFTVGYYAAAGLGCKSDCTYDASKCTGGHCGDGIINGLEECDGVALGSASCGSLGYLGALSELACSDACTFSSSSCLCTTGRCQPGTEQCVCSKTGCGCVAK